ncbi:MAG: SURF1 family protein [Paracoccaceae bacterium]|nr:SURF1 family protein [Paracoccaceae bacterium]
MRRFLLPLIFGIAGTGVLISLGVWQLQRLAWKEAILAEIDARIVAAPVALPERPVVDADRYLPVRIEGRTVGEELNVLVSTKASGAGYRVISAFETDHGRRIMVDEGYIWTTEKNAGRPATAMTVTGNLHWPEEVDRFTPEPDLAAGIWFARDVPRMAEALGAEPVLVIARTVSGTDPRATPLPVDSSGIPNDHLGYAIQWFGLATVWAGMTAFFLWRMRRRRPEGEA